MSSEQDRGLLELAAKAAGYAFAGHDFLPEGAVWAHELGAEPNYDGELPIFMWNPLGDDGDALRLAVKLQLDVWFECGCVYAGDSWKKRHDDRAEELRPDSNAATRRAITRAAAALAKGEGKV